MSDSRRCPPLIDLNTVIKRPWSFLNPLLGRLLSICGLNQIYAQVHAQLSDPEYDPNFFMKTLRVMDLQFEVDQRSFEHIPKEGPLIVIANHPYGGVDGVVLGALLQRVRSDTKLMGNYLLGTMEGIRGNIIEVDPFNTEASKKANLQGIRSAIHWLRDGGCLGAFPAGEVSSFQWKSTSVVDPRWTDHVVSLAQRTNATLVPIYFEGRNSLFFQLMGLLHPRLRTALLAREFCAKQGQRIGVRIGKPIQPDRIRMFDTKRAATEYLRLKTYSLRAEPKEERFTKRLKLPFRIDTGNARMQPLAPAQASEELRREVDALPPESILVEHGDYLVCCAPASKIEKLLLEIGRLREETFREVQEGTGRERDLDAFDDYYLHLFMWDRNAGEIVGAYRIGMVDQIVGEHGLSGLYTSTLFHFKDEFIERLGPAIELGRSFICIKYQRKHASLALIWRGIGEFVVRNPQYKTLFGPVSITDAYQSISKDLMVHFFREHTFDGEMSRLVRARNAPKASTVKRGISLKNIGAAIQSVDAISAIISGFEEDEKGIPVLLKHYLKLNGMLLSFNVDPAFSNVIDGLILVDLTKTDPRILKRYFGKEGYRTFVDYHRLEESALII